MTRNLGCRAFTLFRSLEHSQNNAPFCRNLAIANAPNEMPLSVDNEANESRTQSLGVKRSLVTSQGAQEGRSALHGPKKQKRDREPSNEEKKILAKPFGENYGFHSAEYKYQLKSWKGRKHFASRRKREGLPPLLHFSDPTKEEESQPNKMSTLSTKDPVGPLAWNQGTSGTIRTSLRENISPASASNLGNNRLATGFITSAVAAAPSPESLESGETHSSPIEISSDEDEGGLLINVEGQGTPEVISVDSDSEEDDDDYEEDYEDEDDEGMEDGEEDERAVVSTSVSSPVLGDRDAHMQLQGDLERHLSNDFQPLSIDAAINRKPIIRLANLSADELEIQYKYCFYGLARDQIDMNRPVICIECLQEGHMCSTCPKKYCSSCSDVHQHSKLQCAEYRRCTNCRERGHDAATCQSKLKLAIICDCCNSNHHIETECPLRHFTSVKSTNPATIKLWISCCNCASKTHLVGDCPALHPDTAPRWSLRTLSVQKIEKLSLQTGFSGLEKAAESRNMRPQGRDIRLRQHQQQSSRPLNQRQTFDDSSEDAQESFLRPPIRRQDQSQGQRGNINITLAKQSDRSQYPQSQPQPQRRSPDPRDRDRDRDRDSYDRYDTPLTNNRSRGAWYESDSFGYRRRSRSPDPYGGGGDSYRPSRYAHDPPGQRRPNPAGSGSLGDRVSYPHSQGSGRHDRGPAGSLSAAPPASLDSYRPTERGPTRPVKSTYQRHGRGQSHAQGQGKRKQSAHFQ